MHTRAPRLPVVALALAPLACREAAPLPLPLPPVASTAVVAPPPAASTPAPSASVVAAPAKPASTAETAALLARADKCLHDPECTEDANALAIAADDAGATGMSCFPFYYGTGVHKDLARARACFERFVTGKGACTGDIDELYLATMLVDGQGGPAEAARANTLFAGCDRSRTSVHLALEEIPKRGATAPVDFCTDLQGSSFDMARCAEVSRDGALIERARVLRETSRRLDEKGKKLAAGAAKAWSEFAHEQALLAGSGPGSGFASAFSSSGARAMLENRRIAALAKLFDYKPATDADPVRAERELAKAYHEGCETNVDQEQKKLCPAARRAFVAYRDAEVAFYGHVHGATFGAKEVARDVKARVTSDYAKEVVVHMIGPGN